MKNICIISIMFFLILNSSVAGAVTLKADTVEVDEAIVNQEQAVTPANPDTGEQKFYFKTDGNLYKLDSAGTESQLDGNRVVAAFAPLPDLNETRIETFAVGHGYAKQSAAGTQSDDTTEFIVGGQSLKLVSDGDGLVVFSRSAVLSSTLDFSGKSLVVQFKVSDVSAVTEFTVYLTSDSFASAWYVFPIDDTNLNKYVGDNEWVTYTMNFSDATVVGSPNRAAINRIQFRIKDDSVSPVTLNMQVLGTVPEPERGMLTFAFDDGWNSQYNEAKKKMSEVGFPATAYVIKDRIGTAGYMTVAQLHELENLHRWEIAAHHETDLTTVSLADAETRIQNEKQWLIDNGFNRGSDHFSIPNGALNENLTALFRRYFRTTRTIGVKAETFPPADWHRLRVLNVLSTTTTADIANAVDAARINNHWLILVFHKIVAAPSVSTEFSIANFATVVDDIAADGIVVKTISQAIRSSGPVGDIIGLSFTAKGSTSGTTRLIPSAVAGNTTITMPATTGTMALRSDSQFVQEVTTTDVTDHINNPATLVPLDDTPPQITEGDEYMAITVTPTHANNILIIEYMANITADQGVASIASLYQDATATALHSAIFYTVGANIPVSHVGKFKMLAGTTSPTTFRLRIGPHSAATMYMNSLTGMAIMGDTLQSFIKVTEFQP